MSHPRRKTLATILWLLLGASAAVAQVDTLTGARELYASAAYEDALAVLDRLKVSGAPSDLRAVDQYRAFCLLALGRRTEAEQAIAAVVEAAPQYEPGEAEVSPRVRTAFAEVRRRMLPAIVQQRYAEAKSSFDRKDHASAAALFRETLALLDDPALESARDPALADLRTLAGGFMELSVAAAAPPPPPPAPVPAPPPPPAPVVDPQRVYSSADTDVAPPTAVRQEMPRFQRTVGWPAGAKGIIEVLINERGRVDNVTVRQGINAMFDQMLIDAAKRWTYEPARRNGAPVKYRKIIQVTLDRS
jgi:TonB family protein